MLINYIDKSSAKIISFLAISPGSEYTRKEIKEKTKINNVPLDESLNRLLILKMINNKDKLYYLNLENLFVKQALGEIKEKISNLPSNVQFILIEFIDAISKIKNIQKIILFGSYSKLIFTDKSDIDIAIIFLNKIRSQEKIEKRVSLIAQKISKKHKKEIQEHFFAESDLKHKEDPLIKDILRNGIELT